MESKIKWGINMLRPVLNLKMGDITARTDKSVSFKSWGRYQGEDLFLFRIENRAGAYVELTNYGAAIVSVVVPDKHNKPGNVVVGFSVPEGYTADTCYIGSTVGRFANRIAGASFTLNGVSWHLDRNDCCHSNHGGMNGFNSRVFKFHLTDDGVTFSLLSNDGEGGYPGNLTLTVDYRWSDDCELLITYTALTDKPTVANFTNHAYFNLSGGSRKIFGHTLTVASDRILESREDHIPTGRIVPSGILSFISSKIRDKVRIAENELSGINSYYILDENKNGKLQLAAELSEEETGRKLGVYTTYPGVMVYTGDFLKSDIAGHASRPYGAFDGVCLECQYYPDSPNHPLFPSTVLAPGQSYKHQIAFRFGLI